MERVVHRYPSLISTNAEATRLLSSGEVASPFFLVSDYQEYGRGQGENHWISDHGKNILMSWVVFPAFLSVHHQFQLSKAVSLAISDFLQSFSMDSKIKWPNDIVYDNMKVAGILIENSLIGSELKNSTIGIGLNVNQTEFPDFSYKATSMKTICSMEFQVEEVIVKMMQFLESRYEQLERGESYLIDEQYLNRLFRIDEKSDFSIGSKRFSGIIRGVNEVGELQLETDKGVFTYGFHEIRMHY